ncbi:MULTISPECIES: DNA-binding response regulator [unclassified Hyphomicrobium]|uniref:response regulator transcription factor n=1 Tax=unclassified Hyphomicrobium TaxID=2619925 RepID=UPI000213ED2D|nr:MULTISPECIES: DNA-binding response regulator [unclassified Hyphomicrobium]CCB64775.1 putative response regulator; input and output domains: CheY and LuxR family [Hyphomicrobium sp. MC1]
MTDAEAKTIVLVVDDNPDTLAMLTAALEQIGALVLIATDGERAMTTVARIVPDIILLDAVMPNMDGFETCRRMKRLPALADVPIIFMTGLRDTERIIEGLEAGGVDYVTKPVIIEELLARIRVHVGNARMSRSARAALDTTGRYLFAADSAGRLLWSTPQASKLLGTAFEDFDERSFAFPSLVVKWLAARIEGSGDPSSSTLTIGAEQKTLSLSFVGRMSGDERLMRVSEESSSADASLLKEKLGLTTREAEVLLWIARGKSNRDIGQILGMSPRTVNKHLEQVYVKLGVENRAAAAATAVRHLP